MAIPTNINVQIEANPKPPIGVSPYWYVYPKRILELVEAIERRVDFAIENCTIRDVTQDYRLIAKWATELAKLAEFEAEMECDECQRTQKRTLVK